MHHVDSLYSLLLWWLLYEHADYGGDYESFLVNHQFYIILALRMCGSVSCRLEEGEKQQWLMIAYCCHAGSPYLGKNDAEHLLKKSTQVMDFIIMHDHKR